MITRVADSKAALRTRLRADRLAGHQRAADQDVAAGLLSTALAAGILDVGGNQGSLGPGVITAYIAAPGEPEVAAIRATVRAAGGTVLLPIPRSGRVLEWAVDDGCYRPDPRLPVEVPCGEPIATGARDLVTRAVHLVLVPALAVDTTGTRLGQGGGYYDQLLNELGDLPGRPARIVAVVHDDELLSGGTIPREPHDTPISAVLTPTRFLELDL